MLEVVSRVAVFYLPRIFLGFFIKFILAALGAEVVGLTLVVRIPSGSFGVDDHTADWIFNHSFFPFG